MKPTTFFLLITLASALSISSFSQSLDKPITKSELASIVTKKAGSGGFVMLTPDDLKGYSTANLDDPCSAALSIGTGQTIIGTLANTDCRLDDGSYADFYLFNGTQGQQLTIDLRSTAFDTYLGLANDTGTFVVEDDNGGGGTDSRLIATLPQTGLYVILANSLLPNSFGPYTISVADTTLCTYSFDPTSHQLPGNGGTYSFTVNTAPGCHWSVTYDVYSFVHVETSSGVGPGRVTYTADPNASANPDGAPRSTIIRINNTFLFNVNQSYLACSYSIGSNSADHGPDAGTYQFQMNTAVGCPWIAYYGTNDYWLWTTNELRRGPGPVVYTVSANNGSNRSGTITVAGFSFTVNQSGRNCTYSFTPTSLRLSSTGGNGLFTVDTQPGCTWNFSGGYNYVYFPYGYGGTGPGQISYTVWPNNSFGTRTWDLQFSGVTTSNIHFTQTGIPYRTSFDFFGDSKVDISLYRPSTHQWILRDSQYNGLYTYNFGSDGDVIAPGDFNGDRSAEIAVFRPGNGVWYLLDRGTNTYSAVQFGSQGDVPTPADFDGDGKTDIAVFRPSTGIWYIMRSSDLGVSITKFGTNGDAPVTADYDGDGKSDIAIWRPFAGEWWILSSINSGVSAGQFGTSTDRAVPGDYTGDGKADIAFWRPSTGYWFVLRSEDFSYFAFPFGISEDIPAPGDYDADGVFDAAVFRPSNATWYVNRSGSTPLTAQFGSPGDIPVPSAFVR